MTALMGNEVCPIRSTGSLVLRDGREAHIVRRALSEYADACSTIRHDDTDTAFDLVTRAAQLEASLTFNVRESDPGLFALIGASS